MRRDGKLSIFQFYVTIEIYVVIFTLEDNLFKKVKISVSERVPLNGVQVNYVCLTSVVVPSTSHPE